MPSVAEVIELQRHIESLGTQGRNSLLQIIALLAGNLMISFQQAGNFYLVLRMISFLFMIFIGIFMALVL